MVAIKRLEEIGKADFDMSPYWMFYSGPNDEYDAKTTLISQDHPAYDRTAVRLIRSEYTLNSGPTLVGFLYENPPRFEKHTIFIRDTAFDTWYGICKPRREYIAFIYDMLQLGKEDIFPIRWQSHGKEYAGAINGFGYMENGVEAVIK